MAKIFKYIASMILDNIWNLAKEWPISAAYLVFALILSIGVIGVSASFWAGFITFGGCGLLLMLILAMES